MNILFLDLEDTIITPATLGWHLCELINVDKIKRFISNNNIEVVSIFSFAVHDKREKMLFEKHNRAMIEQALGHSLFRIPTVDDDIVPACARQKSLAPSLISFQEMVEFWGKDLAFQLFLKEDFQRNRTPINIFFLDDAIEDFHFEIPKLALTVKTFNIDDLQ